GHLQTNKVKYIIDKVHMIHSVDSFHLAEEIDKRAEQKGITMDVLIQVNSAEEESKFGITTEETGQLIMDILDKCPNIRVKGLMCIAPFEDDPDNVRVYFAAVKKLYDEYAKILHEHLDFQYLSMGMSHDFEVAIEEGSNLIRVGTAIFGERDYSKKN
ncbi:MAG: YggS family pyridoxal phosphate-dependent enzyme, partial [Anaerovorax sp.]